MEKVKAILRPQTPEACLTPDTQFSMIRIKRDMTLSLNSIDDYKPSKYIGKLVFCCAVLVSQIQLEFYFMFFFQLIKHQLRHV